MSENVNTNNTVSEIDELSERWDQIAYRMQGSPLADLNINTLAKTVTLQSWTTPRHKTNSETFSRYIYSSFEELIKVEKLDLESAKFLLDICESVFKSEDMYCEMGNLKDVDNQVNNHYMRLIERFGLNRDFPIALSHLDESHLEVLAAEGIQTFLDLMGFLDKLFDHGTIRGSYQVLQKIFAHGDEQGLSDYFPYRIGSTGFHLPETLALILSNLSIADQNELSAYHEGRDKRKLAFGRTRAKLPYVVEKKVLPKIFECLAYFGQRKSQLPRSLLDGAYLSRELMHLNDPKKEALLHWLVRLSLGLIRPESARELTDSGEFAVLQKEIKQVENLGQLETAKELRCFL